MKTYKAESSAIRAAKNILAKAGYPELLKQVSVLDTDDGFVASLVASPEVVEALEKVGNKAIDVQVNEMEEEPERSDGYISESSTVSGAVALVHQIADSMPKAKRSEVIEACRKAGVAYGTARTQYQRWRSNKKEAEAKAE